VEGGLFKVGRKVEVNIEKSGDAVGASG